MKMSDKITKSPSIRFAGFTGAWEQRKVGALTEFNPKAELPDIFKYVDLESVVGTEMICHREEKRATAPSRAQRLAKQGDLFYQTVRPYQCNNYLFENPDNDYVFSTGYAQMRPQCDGYFLLCLVQNDSFVKCVLDRCTGTSYPAINANDLADIEVKVPNDKVEQQQIGEHFRNLDNLITLHQRKLELMKTIKKAMLQKMFPKDGESVPEIRFAGFTGAWEQRKLGDLGKATGGTSIESEFIQDGKYKVINIGSYSETSIYSDQGIRVNKTNRTESRILNKDDLTMILNDKTASGNIIGRVLLIDADNLYVYNQQTERIEVDKNKFIPQFLYQLLNADNIRSKIIRASQGNTQIYVNWSTISDLQYSITISKLEQQKLGEYFKNIDNLITLYQRELDLLKDLKKSMLQQMFI